MQITVSASEVFTVISNSGSESPVIRRPSSSKTFSSSKIERRIKTELTMVRRKKRFGAWYLMRSKTIDPIMTTGEIVWIAKRVGT